MPVATINLTNETTPSIAPPTCSSTSDLTLQTLQQQMVMMQALIVQVHNNNEATSKGPRHEIRNPNQLKYCHTHGVCNHDSPNCHSKAEGHKDEATFQNRMGGSTKNIKTWQFEPKLPFKFKNIQVNKPLTQYSTCNVSSIAQTFNNSSITIKADTGATKHYFRAQDSKHLNQVQPTKN